MITLPGSRSGSRSGQRTARDATAGQLGYSVAISAPAPALSAEPARVVRNALSGAALPPPLPTFEFRGFFVNDEDMLAGFAADPLGASMQGTGTDIERQREIERDRAAEA